MQSHSAGSVECGFCCGTESSWRHRCGVYIDRSSERMDTFIRWRRAGAPPTSSRRWRRCSSFHLSFSGIVSSRRLVVVVVDAKKWHLNHFVGRGGRTTSATPKIDVATLDNGRVKTAIDRWGSVCMPALAQRTHMSSSTGTIKRRYFRKWKNEKNVILKPELSFPKN